MTLPIHSPIRSPLRSPIYSPMAWEWDVDAATAWSTILDSLASETDGAIWYFTDPDYPRELIRDTTTPANSADRDANTGLTYTSPSLKNRTASDGLVKYAAHNLALYSEDITNAAWTKYGSTASSVSEFREAATTNSHGIYEAISTQSGQRYEFAVEVKANGRDHCIIQFEDSSTTNKAAWFNLSTGAVGTKQSGVESSAIVSVGDGWYRISAVRQTDATTTYFFILNSTNGSDGEITDAYAGDTGKGLFVRKAHLRAIPADDTYITTTSAAKYRLPIDHDSAGDPLGLLVEEARTNLLTYSEQFDNAAWSKNAASITATNVTAPDGTATGDTVTGGGVSDNIVGVTRQVTITSAATHAFSAYVKAGTHNYILLTSESGSEHFIAAVFDLSAGAGSATQTDTGTTSGTLVSTSITDVGGGWYRLCMVGSTDNSGNGGLNRVTIAFASAASGNTINATGRITLTTSNTFSLCGAQLEAGSFPTSYIRTTSATVTRAADNISKAVTGFCYSSTVGYVLARAEGQGGRIWCIGGSDAEQIQAAWGANNHLQVTDNSSTQAGIDAGGMVNGVYSKLAAAWEANNFGASIDGGAAVTDVSGTIPTPTALQFGGRRATFDTLNGHVQYIKYLPRRVSDADLALESAA